MKRLFALLLGVLILTACSLTTDNATPEPVKIGTLAGIKALQAQPTAQGTQTVNGVLFETGQRLICYVVDENPVSPSPTASRTPTPTFTLTSQFTPFPTNTLHPIFEAATFFVENSQTPSNTPTPTRTPTTTTVPLITRTPPPTNTAYPTSTLATPTQEFATSEPPTLVVITYTVIVNALNVRGCPSTSCSVTGVLGSGQTETFTGRQEITGTITWVELTGGRGWAAKSQNGTVYLQ